MWRFAKFTYPVLARCCSRILLELDVLICTAHISTASEVISSEVAGSKPMEPDESEQNPTSRLPLGFSSFSHFLSPFATINRTFLLRLVLSDQAWPPRAA
jgi:hypothetical protein